MMRVEYVGETMHGTREFRLVVDALEYANTGKEILNRACVIAAEKIAEQYVAEHGIELLTALNPQAIATMAVAAAGAEVADTLKHKHAERVVTHTHERVDVYQRGIFGGLRRVR